MAIIKIRVQRAPRRLEDRLRCLVDDMLLFNQPVALCDGSWVPSLDVYESKDAVYLVFDAAGIEKESLELVVEGQVIRITGQRNSPVALRQKRYLQMEIEYGPFERTVRIPVAFDPDEVDARYENGMLVVRLNKRPNDAVTVKIT